jgi:hypothetical protein
VCRSSPKDLAQLRIHPPLVLAMSQNDRASEVPHYSDATADSHA